LILTQQTSVKLSELEQYNMFDERGLQMFDKYNKRIPYPKLLFNLKEISKKILTTNVPIQC